MFFDIDIVVRPGAHDIAARIASDAVLTALVGPSGRGKTSVLNAVAGLLTPRSGRIVVAGRTIFNSDAEIDIRPERRRAGYVFQDTRLFPHRRVAANLDYAERLARGESGVVRDQVVELLDIATLMDRWPATLSGGEKRRVAIARALLSAPAFLLLDEPMSSLDEGRAASLSALIVRIRDELGIPILLVSHSREEVAALAGHVATMP